MGTDTSRLTPLAAETAWDGHYALRLYVAGQTPKSIAAIRNLTLICEAHLADRYTIAIVDLRQNPELAAGDQILALPTLVRYKPSPLVKIIGDLSNTERVLMGLEIPLVGDKP